MSISGKYLTATVNGVVLDGNYAWDSDEESKELGRTTGASGGFTDVDQGVQSLVVTIKGYMDLATGNYAVVRQGQILNNVQLFRSELDANPAFILPVAAAMKSKQGAEVEGKVEWNATLKNKGQFLYGDPGQAPS